MNLNILLLAECQLECIFCSDVKVLYTVYTLSSAFFTVHPLNIVHQTLHYLLYTFHTIPESYILQTLHCNINSTPCTLYTALCTVLLTVHTPEIPFAKCHLQASGFLPSNSYLPPMFSTIHSLQMQT